MAASETEVLRFESPPRTLGGFLRAVVVWAFAGVCAAGLSWGNWTHPWEAVTIVFDLLSGPVVCWLLWMAWVGGLHLKVELCASPREARCRRTNIFTSLRTRHRYPIRGDARVILRLKATADDTDSDLPPAVEIEGLPSYYDFRALGQAKTLSDSWEIARKIASFLNLPFVDDYGNPHSTRDRGRYVWAGTGPYVSRPRRRRKKKSSKRPDRTG